MGNLEVGFAQHCCAATIELLNQMQSDAHSAAVIASFKTGGTTINVNGQPELREEIGTLGAGKSMRKSMSWSRSRGRCCEGRYFI